MFALIWVGLQKRPQEKLENNEPEYSVYIPPPDDEEGWPRWDQWSKLYEQEHEDV